MFRRHRRGLGFFPGLVVGTVLGLGVSAVFAPGLCNGVRWLQQEELGWRTRAGGFTSQARTQADAFVAQTETDLQEQLSRFAEAINRVVDASAEN
ncbi:MAG: hypothetical protein HY675_00520 [Chloroflexi bacterium]|nr:hypothetical protein [Chloroflexota bacterium]